MKRGNFEWKDDFIHQGMRRRLADAVAKKGNFDSNIIEAIATVPRHFFLDPAFDKHAYEDKAFPIGEGQTISQPYTVAYQTQLLQVKKGDRILEIGTGSGYQASILAVLGARLYSIERMQSLSDKALEIMTHLKYKARLFVQDGTLGLKQHAPFNKIIVTAAAPVVPEELRKQLVVGGILVIPVGDRDTQKMLKISRESEEIFITEMFEDFKFVPLIGKEGWK